MKKYIIRYYAPENPTRLISEIVLGVSEFNAQQRFFLNHSKLCKIESITLK